LKNSKRVALIFGGVSTEHDVSIVSAESIAESIDTDRFDPVYVAIDKIGAWYLGPGAFEYLKSGKCSDVERVVLSTDPDRLGFYHLDSGSLTEVDVVFPVLHGPRGEDGSLQGLLELAQIPYVGCDPMSSSIAMDKDMTKRVLAQRGIPVVKGTCVSKWMWDNTKEEVLKEISETLSLPLFIKPSTMGSSIGITHAFSTDDITAGIDMALGYSTKVVVEMAVQNPFEIEVSVLGNNDPQASLPGQIVPANGFYDFNAKYMDGTTELVVPAHLNRQITEDIQFMAIDAFVAIGGCGMARVDFLVSDTNIYVNEINTIPGFTGISMYPKMWEVSGLPYRDLISTLIELAIRRHETIQTLTKTIDLEKGLGV